MRGTFTIQDPDKITATLTMAATIKEWRELKEQLTSRWPSCDLAMIIGELIYDMTRRGIGKDTSDAA